MRTKFSMRLFVSMVALTAMLTQAGAAMADSVVGATAGIQVQNLDSAENQIDGQLVDQTGAVVKTWTEKIPGSSSKTYASLDAVGQTSAFNGSAIISSGKPVAAIVNIAAASGSGARVVASYGGVSSVSSELTMPLIMKNNGGKINDTKFNVQNASAGDVSVTITYVPSNAGNTGCKQTATIKKGSSRTFDQRTDSDYTGCSGTGLGDKFVGSAKVVATGGNIAAAALQASTINLLSYTGFSSGSLNPVFPLINSFNNGNVTGIQIANLGTQNTDVTVSYTPTPGNGTACTEKQTIVAGSSATFALAAFDKTNADENCIDQTKFVGAARVTVNSTSQPLVAVVNQTNNAKGFGSAYGAFDPAKATAKVSLPLIIDSNGGFKNTSGISIANVGNSAVSITCVYSAFNGNTPAADTENNVAPGGSMVRFNSNLVSDGAYVGSATCTATGSGETKIVGVVNQSAGVAVNPAGVKAGDGATTYEGFNQ